MKSLSLLFPSLLSTTVAAGPAPTRDKRATTWCDAYAKLETGTYTMYHNNWGADKATSGYQCTTLTANNGGWVEWSTDWTWEGGPHDVKSYSNVAIDKVDKKLWEIDSMPSIWNWSNTGTNVVADVAYDLWLAPMAGANSEYEVMIWVGAIGGAGPISETGSTPIASPTILGRQWNLFKGPNGDFTVFSFVATSNIETFDGDLKPFLDFLTSSQGVSVDMTLTSLGAGTEPFTGSNSIFKTHSFTMSVN